VLLKSGSDVPADGIIIEASDILVDENLHQCRYLNLDENYMVQKETVDVCNEVLKRIQEK